MANERSRLQAETRFQRVQRTDQESKSIIETERDAVRKKTAGLKTLRLANEAATGITEANKKRAARKKSRSKAKT